MPALALNCESKGTKFVSFVTYAFLKFIHIQKIVVMANSFFLNKETPLYKFVSGSFLTLLTHCALNLSFRSVRTVATSFSRPAQRSRARKGPH